MKSRILIVDESPLTAENIRGRLSSFGDTVVVRDLPALALARKEQWSVVVTAWSLGTMVGEPLIKECSALQCPVYLYSAQTEVVEGTEWAALGVVKAFTHLQRADLVLAVEHALAQSGRVSGTQHPCFLLVEDSPTVRQFVKSVLKQSFPDAEIIEAEDGRQALATMKSNRISLIITDLQMPGMDGMSFIQLLHNNAVLRKKPVLVLSGAVNDEVRTSLASLAQVQVLTKPSTPQQVTNAVRLLLG